MFKPLTSNTPLACLPHDHSRCVADALAEAEALCAKQGTRLTTLRKRVLELRNGVLVRDEHDAQYEGEA